MALLDDNDILFAHKALNVMSGLSEQARRVAGAIIDHFNKRTGQCDPGNERLATLLGIDVKTVRRATAQLDELNLIKKTSHGGKAHRARYEPNWELLRAVVVDWDARMKTGSAPTATLQELSEASPNRAKLSGSTGRDCPVKQGEIALQTLRSNQSKKPIEEIPADTAREKPKPQRMQTGRNGLLRRSEPTAQKSMLLALAGGKSVSHGQAARSAAERRWDAAVRAMGQDAHADVIDWMTCDRQEAATQAEMARRGGGLAFIVDGMGQRRSTACG